MNYATLAQLKSYLWISWTSSDTILQALLDSSYVVLNNLFGVDTMNEASNTDTVDVRKIYHNVWYYGYNVFLKNKPVSSLTSINWTTYTWVKGTDYLIVYDRKAVIKDLQEYITTLVWDYFDIVYVSGYDRDNVKLLDNAAAVDATGWIVTIPLTANGYSEDEVVTIAWSTNYNGNYTIVAVATDTFNITATYNAETFAWTETCTSIAVPWPNDELPNDIALLQMMLTSGLYNTKWNEWIKQYKLWDESITFKDINWTSADDLYFSFKVILDKYKTFTLP